MDVVIVGGAVVGSAAAYFLRAQTGFNGSVLVIEKDFTYEQTATVSTAAPISGPRAVVSFATFSRLTTMTRNALISSWSTPCSMRCCGPRWLPVCSHLRPPVCRTAWPGHYGVYTLVHNVILGAHPEVHNLLFADGLRGHGMQQSAAVWRALSELVTFGNYRALA